MNKTNRKTDSNLWLDSWRKLKCDRGTVNIAFDRYRVSYVN